MKNTDIKWHEMSVSKAHRAELLNQKPFVIWLTGLSASGKSTLASATEKALYDSGYKTYLLDGDNIRHGICSDLGFSDRDRTENIRRLSELCKLFVNAGIIVIASFISPFERDRKLLRHNLDSGEFIEVFVDTPLEICEQRDPKGLYKKARAGIILNFTGISSPYEKPKAPEIHITNTESVTHGITTILNHLNQLGYISIKS